MDNNPRPILLTVIDTEEEFNWLAPLNQKAISVAAMDQVAQGQRIFDDFGVVPTYVISYPVASQSQGYLPLKRLLNENRATLGAHLHPWNTPPFTNDADFSHGFPGNLPSHLEAAKLETLVTQIKQTCEFTPVVYKAGRYGIGANTASILEAQGFEVDLSPSPPFDFQAEGGPDFSHYSNQPRWFGLQQQMLSLPTTGGYVGPFSAVIAHQLFTWSRQPWPKALHLPGLLSRFHLVNRQRLSPEGHTLEELITLTKTLLKRQEFILSFSFHSPSLLPGCTPYVQNEGELHRFLERIRGYLDFFQNQLGGIFMTPLAIKHHLQKERG